MEKFFEIVNILKIPTLGLMGIFLYTGFSLVKDSNFNSLSGISGSILLCVSFIFGLILFIDYRYKEQSEHIIKEQSKAIDNLSRALKNTSDTHSKIEKNTQANIDGNLIGKEGGKQYSIEDESETFTR